MRVRLSWTALVVLLTGACSTAPPWVAPEEHQRLARQMLELERRAAQAELEIERLKHRVVELETPAAAATPPRVSPSPPPLPVIEREDVEPGWRASRQAIEESELAELQSHDPSDGTNASSDYELGLMMLRDGRPAEAEAALARFASDEPASDLADNAWFWIGESRLSRGDTAGAIAAYRDCLDKYPQGNKVPDAMLKLGHALERSGDAVSAREVWSELLRRFPSTAAAESARGRLAML